MVVHDVVRKAGCHMYVIDFGQEKRLGRMPMLPGKRMKAASSGKTPKSKSQARHGGKRRYDTTFDVVRVLPSKVTNVTHGLGSVSCC
jgi:hypothetical protein